MSPRKGEAPRLCFGLDKVQLAIFKEPSKSSVIDAFLTSQFSQRGDPLPVVNKIKYDVIKIANR